MADIFTPWQMGQLELPNRLVRSATWEGLAEEHGVPSHELINATAELAEGGVGLIITGFAYIQPNGQALPRQTGVHVDANIGPLTRISDAVHKAGGKVAMQIVHAGGQSSEKLIGEQPVGPSAMVNPSFGGQVRELTLGEIFGIIDNFALAAARAKAAGFDAVQLHGAHGYLINQFLAQNTNLRDDDYGGPIENRARLCVEVYRAVRDAVGPDFPVFVKLNTDDAVDDGFKLQDALLTARWLDERGIDAIEVSGGTRAAGDGMPSRKVVKQEDEAYFLDNALAVKQAVKCPVIVVGGFRSPAVITKALDQVEAVSICRPFINEPNLAKRWQEGDTSKAECVSCNKCFEVTAKQGLGCYVNIKKAAKEAGN